MKNINSRMEIEKRNEIFIRDFLNLSLDEYFKKLASAGKPKGYADNIWSEENPTAGRCGSVIGALRLSNKIPKDYIACGQNELNGGSHFYLINTTTNEVIDPTSYQMNKEYNYENYHTKFLPQISKNVADTLNALDLKIDETKFKVVKDKRGVKLAIKIKK
jgi:hypothetical protein